MLQKILLICLIAVLLASCGGRRRAERSTMSSCSVPTAGACKPCRIACPAGETPKCVAGQGDATTCNQPASCTCE